MEKYPRLKMFDYRRVSDTSNHFCFSQYLNLGFRRKRDLSIRTSSTSLAVFLFYEQLAHTFSKVHKAQACKLLDENA